MSGISLAPRSHILHRLRRDPGLHLRELARRVELPLGTVRYHLVRLEEREQVVRHRAGRFVRWFPRENLSRRDRALISALRVHSQRLVIATLMEEGAARFSVLGVATGLSSATLSRNLRKLTRSGLVTRSGWTYRLADPEAVREGLARFRGRFPDLLAEAAMEVFGGF